MPVKAMTASTHKAAKNLQTVQRLIGRNQRVLYESTALEIERVDFMGAEDHFEGKFKDGNLPGIIHAFNDGARRIAGAADIIHHPLADGVQGVVNDLLVNIAAPELKTILQEREVLALGTE